MADLKLLLVGYPNAGKSTLFNALTGGHAKVGNWHGVTVGALEKESEFSGEAFTAVDLPGVYSLAGMSMEEKYTRDYLFSHGEGTVVFVSECGGIERSLALFLALLRKGRTGMLVLTKKKLFERAGGKLNAEELEKRLGAPVLVTEGLRGGRLKEAFFRKLRSAAKNAPAISAEDALKDIYAPVREGLSRADRLLCNGFFCVPLFLALLLFTFFLTFAPGLPGDALKSGIEWLFGDLFAGWAEGIPSPVARGFVTDGILSGLGGVLCFLPQIAILFLILTIMEESGFLSRLAMLSDPFFAKLGLNGRAVFSLLMGFGCTAAAMLTTRGLDDRKIQRRVLLCLPYIPCSAKLPVFLTLGASFFSNPFWAVVALYALGVAFSALAALLLRGEQNPSFVMELAPLQLPSPLFTLKSLLFQLKQFIIKVATVVLAFFLLSWLLSSFDFSFRFCSIEESMLAKLCGGLKFLFAPIGMGDWKIAYAALSGLIAKENVAGALAMFYGGFPYSAASGFAFAFFLLLCSPCVSAIAACARETGWKRALCYAAFQTGSALLASYLVYFVLSGGAVFVVPAGIAAVPLVIFGKKIIERIRRKRGNHPEKLHG